MKKIIWGYHHFNKIKNIPTQTPHIIFTTIYVFSIEFFYLCYNKYDNYPTIQSWGKGGAQNPNPWITINSMVEVNVDKDLWLWEKIDFTKLTTIMVYVQELVKNI